MTTAPVIVSTRERRAGIIQVVGHRPDDVPRRPWESFAVFMVSTVAYGWIGWWLVTQMHVVGFETLDRLNRALMLWHNEPPKLAAIGFDHPPLATLLLTPLTIFTQPVRSLVVVPLASALFAGLVMMTLNSMLRRAQVVAPLRYAVLIAFAANPLFVLYASSGSRHIMWLAFSVAALGALFAWYVTADVRFVMIAGLAYSIAALAGYTSLLWFVVSALMVGAVLARLGADGFEVEGTTVGFAVPTVYVVALWTAFNLILLWDPFHWITSNTDLLGSGGFRQMTLLEVLQGTGELVLFGAPLAIVVLPALLFSGFARRNTFALWLGALLAATILTPLLSVLLGSSDDPMLMRNALPVLLVSVVGAIWLARSAGTTNSVVAGLLVVGLLASVPWTFQAMKSYPYQNLEAPFAEAVSTQESQEGSLTLDGSTVGVVSEEAMATYIRNNVTARSSILTDNAQTYAVMLLTGRPDLFFDRVDMSDGPWTDAARDPASHVDYLLMTTDTDTDQLARIYPEAASGASSQLTVVYRTERYVLASVPPGFERADESSENAGTQPVPGLPLLQQGSTGEEGVAP